MAIKTANFAKSSADYRECPNTPHPEYAFIGRSNVGKSSLINMICNRNALAKISSKPGKTQLINHFLINDSWYLVDLPGYGWSKVSKVKKAEWSVMIEEYLLKRENLACLFVLIDSRLEPQKIDYDFIAWAGENEIPLAIIFTKKDKLSNNQYQSIRSKHFKKMKQLFTELPQTFVTSAEKKLGGDEIIQFIEEVNEVFRKNS